jgi:hypothetical protein
MQQQCEKLTFVKVNIIFALQILKSFMHDDLDTQTLPKDCPKLSLQ